MTRDFEIILAQPLEHAQLDAVLADQPGFEHPPASMPSMAWNFYAEDPRLLGCAWISKPTERSLVPGAMEEESLQRIQELLGAPPRVSVNVETSSDDPHGKNALHVALLLGAHFPNLVVFAWNDHFHTLTDCQRLWEEGRGFPWTWE